MNQEIKVMRDVFIEELYRRMHDNDSIFFVAADFGSPKLDLIRSEFKERFLNVGIAEQNLINVSTGLALEGYTVYAYAIAPFLTMRAYEQIRVNLSIHSQLKDLNINLVGVGAGLSYDVSGPTHHCLEDITIMRTLPNFTVFSPSDWVLAEAFADYSIRVRGPKYLRFDGKPLPGIYEALKPQRIEDGFRELVKGRNLCIVSTGYMTHTALQAAKTLAGEGVEVGVVDVFMLKPLNEEKLTGTLKNYECVVTLEEGFINKGGLDGLISCLLDEMGRTVNFKRLGFKDAYVFDIGSRKYLHKINSLDDEGVIKNIKAMLDIPKKRRLATAFPLI